MARLAVASDFMARFAELERPVRTLVQRAIEKFTHHTHAGLHLEKLEKSRDPRVRTIRINQFYRGVVLAPEHGDVYLLISVLPHDEAIRYALSRRFTVNQALGVLEVRDEERLELIRPAFEHEASTEPERLFAKVNDADLCRLGIDVDLIPMLRLLTRDEHLMALERLLPRAQYDALFALASGMSPDEAWAEVSQLLAEEQPPSDIDATDLVAAMERSPDQILFVTGPTELEQLLRHPFANWRVFLHPTQRRIAYRDSYSGPVQVSGGAGTGKTVTALHRARYLAEHGRGRVLFTTFSKTLASTLQDQLAQLVEDSETRSRIDVVNVDRLANQIVTDRFGRRPRIVGDTERHAYWSNATAQAGSTRGVTFLDREWEQVILAQQIESEADYLACIRSGRGAGLSGPERSRTWQAVEHFTRQLRNDGYWTHLQIAAEAARLLLVDGTDRYQHVIVDEAQDLHPAQWRMLRALAPAGTDDLFVVGDPNQRIYDNRVTLASVGVSVRGRSRRLKMSYRTTQEILSWSVGLLGLVPATAFDGGVESLAGYRAALHGKRPTVRGFANRAQEHEGLVDQVQAWLAAGIEPHAIGVAARTGYLADEAMAALRHEGIPTARLATEQGDQDAVRVGSMHRMKGLEFRCVAVVGVSSDSVPATGAVTAVTEDLVAHGHDLQRERCLLFVACTRARDSLYVSYAGNPSLFLPS